MREKGRRWDRAEGRRRVERTGRKRSRREEEASTEWRKSLASTLKLMDETIKGARASRSFAVVVTVVGG